MTVLLQPGVALQWVWGLPSGLREAVGCVCIEEREALGKDKAPLMGMTRGSPVGLTEGWHCRYGSGVGWTWSVDCVCVRTCASVTYCFSPMTVDRHRLPGPAREGITFWFSRLNAEVSVN